MHRCPDFVRLVLLDLPRLAGAGPPLLLHRLIGQAEIFQPRSPRVPLVGLLRGRHLGHPQRHRHVRHFWSCPYLLVAL